MRFIRDGFLIGMAVAVGRAVLFPGPSARGGILHPELLNKAGVALLFFLHGVALSFPALRAGALRWPLHLLVQASTFLLFPILGLAFLWLAGNRLAPDLRLGFFYLCALPSTISSSVAMTAAARGNVPAALFNATLSSLLGILLTPLWVGWMVRSAGHTLPFHQVIVDLLRWMALPLLAGQLSRPWLGDWSARHQKGIHVVDRATILLLVYTSFCDSVQSGVWSGQGVNNTLVTALGAALLFAAALVLMSTACDALGFNAEDRVAAIFCGSKKSLASSVPMAQLIFGTHPSLGLILLPIMIYHPLQLVVCAVLASRWARRAAG
jgi:sodium/bile acid cotransporter 7